jgi:hypothetical protein
MVNMNNLVNLPESKSIRGDPQFKLLAY